MGLNIRKHTFRHGPAQWLSGRASTLWQGGCRFDTWPGHTKEFKNRTSCSFAWHSALRRRARTGQFSVSIMWLGGISCQSVWGVIFQWGSTLKVSIELPATSRHRRDITKRLLKAMLSPNQTKPSDVCTESSLGTFQRAKDAKFLHVHNKDWSESEDAWLISVFA